MGDEKSRELGNMHSRRIPRTTTEGKTRKISEEGGKLDGTERNESGSASLRWKICNFRQMDNRES